MKIKKQFTTEEPGKIYFMSDLHYNHENVIRYDSRPFKTVQEMNDYIIRILKSTSEEDVIFDLGDMFWNTSEYEIKNILDQIPCKNIYKIMGNHDRYGFYQCQSQLARNFKIVCDILDVSIRHQEIDYMVTMSHYPLVSWNHKSHGSLMIHGHTHSNLDEFNNLSTDLRVDVGFNSELAKKSKTFLVPFEDIVNHFNKKTGSKDYRSWVKNNYTNL